MSMFRIYQISVLMAIFCYSCKQNTISSEQDYYKWIGDKSNHLTLSKTIAGVKITVKFLPPEYLAYNELKNRISTKIIRDSLTKVYKRSRTFLVSFSLDDKTNKEAPDIMYRDISSLEDYNQRFEDLTFNIGNYLQLKTANNIYVPVLHTFENTYGITPNRSIYLVFSSNGTSQDDLLLSSKIELVFNDLIFSTGISYFSFDKSEIDNTPHINFWKR